MKIDLKKIEERLQKLLETGDSILPGNRWQEKLIEELFETMQHSIQVINGRLTADTIYSIHIPASEQNQCRIDEDFLEALSVSLQQTAHESGIFFPAKPFINIETIKDKSIEQEIYITSKTVLNEKEHTAVLLANDERSTDSTLSQPANAYLILPDESLFQLDQAVINIGRRKDNHLVLDDPHISRSHAQVRLVQRKHVIFDLGSSAGTLINGQRIKQHGLKTGDVIKISDIKLIYAEENLLDETENFIPHRDKTHKLNLDDEF